MPITVIMCNTYSDCVWCMYTPIPVIMCNTYSDCVWCVYTPIPVIMCNTYTDYVWCMYTPITGSRSFGLHLEGIGVLWCKSGLQNMLK